MDKSTAFVDDMIRRCIAFVDGGVLVVESGALWFCQTRMVIWSATRRRN